MKAITMIGVASLVAIAGAAGADSFVRPYIRSDGSYVAPHMKTEPNAWRFDNYSSQGNVNPYTGQRGYKPHEFSSPPAWNTPRYSSPWSSRGLWDND